MLFSQRAIQRDIEMAEQILFLLINPVGDARQGKNFFEN